MLREKIIFDNPDKTLIPNSARIHPDLLIPEKIPENFEWKFMMYVPPALSTALIQCNSMQFLTNVLLFVEEYIFFNIEKFKKVVAIAKAHNKFNVYSDDGLEESPLHIAFMSGFYPEAEILIAEGADLEYRDKNGKAAREYFSLFLTETRLALLRMKAPNLCEIFKTEILQFSQAPQDDAKLLENINFLNPVTIEDEILDETDSVSEASIDIEDAIVILEQDAKKILDKDKKYYKKIINTISKIDEKIALAELRTFDAELTYLSQFSAACIAIDELIDRSNPDKNTEKMDETTLNNLYLYFYFILRYTQSFFNCISFLNQNQDDCVSKTNIESVYAESNRVIKFLMCFEKLQYAIGLKKLEYKIDPTTEELLDSFISKLPVKLAVIFRLKSPSFMNRQEIEQEINDQHWMTIKCIHNTKSAQAYFPQIEFTEDFVQQELKPLLGHNQSKQFLFFP